MCTNGPSLLVNSPQWLIAIYVISYSRGVFHSGEVIRTLREARGWTQTMLAAKAGVTDMTISKMERSSTNYRRSSLSAVARALEVAPASLVMPVPDMTPDPLTQHLLTLWATLHPDHRQAGLEALRVVIGWSAAVQQLRTDVQRLLQHTHDDRARRRDDGVEARRLAREARAVRAATAPARVSASTTAKAASTERRRRKQAG